MCNVVTVKRGIPVKECWVYIPLFGKDLGKILLKYFRIQGHFKVISWFSVVVRAPQWFIVAIMKKKNTFVPLQYVEQYIHLKQPKINLSKLPHCMIWSHYGEHCGSAWLDVIRFNYNV